jgi:pimeloyl-ACP methyl ester carboxylesterase
MLQRILSTAVLLAVGASSTTAAGISSSSPTAPDDLGSPVAPIGAVAAAPPSEAQDAQGIAKEFAERYGAPTSTTFNALDERTRAAVERYFLRGRGAVPRDGLVDFATTAPGSGLHAAVPRLLWGDPVPGYKGLFNVTLANTGTGYIEVFLLQVPDVPPQGPTPMLVAFHKFGVSHADVLFNTNFVQECRTRGWYLLAPFGAMEDNYGCLPSQANVTAAIDFVRSSAPVDPGRVYGVGFSMGGGGCASYAARHLDPSESIFAAIVDHTGSVSLWHTYANQDISVEQIMEGLFGGSPAAQHFAYQQCSTVDIDPLTDLVDPTSDMARNLDNVHCWMADQDPNVYLQTETQLFFNDVHALNSADLLTVVSGNVHSWSTMDDTAACDWLSRFTLQEPLTGTTLADTGGQWHRFTVVQDAPGAFTPFNWLSNPPANRLSFWDTANLKQISVDPTRLGLVYSGNLKLNMSSADGTGDQVLWLHVPRAPINVTRNSQPASATYDPVAKTLLIDEQSGSGAQWVIQF